MKRGWGIASAVRLRRRGDAVAQSLGRDARGNTLIEFAMVAAPLFALMLAIIETSIVFFAQQGLETATEAAARSLLTGQAQQAALTQAQFKQTACAALPGFLDCSRLMVDVQSASSFSAVSTTRPTITFDSNGKVTNTFNFTTGGAGDIVIVRLMYIWPLPTGPLGFTLDNLPGSQRLMVATSVAKTEAYS